jgi:DNA replication and repair protein RecF
LEPWTEKVVSLGTVLVAARAEATMTLAHSFTELAGLLGLEAAALGYDEAAPTVAELDARLDRDLDRGLTGAGPHLHDLRLEAKGRELRSFGSQGEQRIAVLALVLAEAEVLRSRTGCAPLLLLDDVLSELDGDRRRSLAAIVSRGGQTVITATAVAAFPTDPAQALAVTPGVVR